MTEFRIQEAVEWKIFDRYHVFGVYWGISVGRTSPNDQGKVKIFKATPRGHAVATRRNCTKSYVRGTKNETNQRRSFVLRPPPTPLGKSLYATLSNTLSLMCQSIF